MKSSDTSKLCLEITNSACAAHREVKKLEKDLYRERAGRIGSEIVNSALEANRLVEQLEDNFRQKIFRDDPFAERALEFCLEIAMATDFADGVLTQIDDTAYRLRAKQSKCIELYNFASKCIYGGGQNEIIINTPSENYRLTSNLEGTINIYPESFAGNFIRLLPDGEIYYRVERRFFEMGYILSADIESILQELKIKFLFLTHYLFSIEVISLLNYADFGRDLYLDKCY
jgi:hypothetical protein